MYFITVFFIVNLDRDKWKDVTFMQETAEVAHEIYGIFSSFICNMKRILTKTQVKKSDFLFSIS